jgi:ribonuclease D
MVFQSTITNEQTAELPSARFDGRIIVVEHEEQVEAACRDLAAQRIIGFDTETRPSFKAGVTNRVALLQLSTHENCYLIRLCRTKLHSPILKILSSPDILKIGADVAGDLRSLHVLRHFHERGFVDLQHIASHWGIEEKSLRKMSAIVLGQRVSKAQRLSNWEASTLTPQQQMYAATDAWVCISIYEKLMATEPLTPLPSLSEKEQPKDKETEVANTGEATEHSAEIKGNDAEKKSRSRHRSRSHHRHHRSSKKKSENEKQQ